VEHQRCAFEFCVRLGKSGSETLQLIHQAYGAQISPYAISGFFQPWKWSSKARKPPVPLSSWSMLQTVRSTFSRSGWSVVRSASLAKGSTSKKRQSPHLRKVPTRNNNVCPQTFQMALVVSTLYCCPCMSPSHTDETSTRKHEPYLLHTISVCLSGEADTYDHCLVIVFQTFTEVIFEVGVYLSRYLATLHGITTV
jgi:hypothetical protein